MNDTSGLVVIDDVSKVDDFSEVDIDESLPLLMFRKCKTPDCSRTVAGWMVYSDVNNMFPLEKGWTTPDTPSPAPYKVCPVKGKGRGIFATRDIKDGELIIRERPIIIFPPVIRRATTSLKPVANTWNAMEEDLKRILSFLEVDDRKKVLELHNCKSADECGPITGILRTNNIGAEFTQAKFDKKYAAVCLNISYANHSCARNARYTFDDKDVVVSLIADRDIPAGEEITISYVSMLRSRAERREELERKYRFTCACASCAKPDDSIAASDKRRKFIQETAVKLDSVCVWQDWLNCPPFQRKSYTKRQAATIEEFLREVEREGLTSRQWKRMSYIRGTVFYGALCDVKNFKKWARLLMTVEDEGERVRIEGWIKDPTTFPLWELERKTRGEYMEGTSGFLEQ